LKYDLVLLFATWFGDTHPVRRPGPNRQPPWERTSRNGQQGGAEMKRDRKTRNWPG